VSVSTASRCDGRQPRRSDQVLNNLAIQLLVKFVQFVLPSGR